MENLKCLLMVIPNKIVFVLSDEHPNLNRAFNFYSEQDKTYFINNLRNEGLNDNNKNYKIDCVIFSRPLFVFPSGWLMKDTSINTFLFCEKEKEIEVINKKVIDYEVIFPIEKSFISFLIGEYPRMHFYHASEFSIPLACLKSNSKSKIAIVNIFSDVMESVLSENGKLINYLIQPDITTAEDALYYLLNSMRQYHFKEEETSVHLCITDFDWKKVISLFKKYLLIENANVPNAFNLEYFKKYHPVI